MFPLSATFSTLPDFEAIRGGKIEEVVGDLFNLFYFTEFFPTPFSSETAVTAGEE